jgi:hypothetical protein
MPDERYRQILLKIAAHSCERLFEHYGIELRPLEQPAAAVLQPLLCCGVAGFHGRAIRGTAILGTSREILTRSNPTTGNPGHRDWTAELANQFVGRMKNQLLQHALELQMATPAVIRGPDIDAGRWQHLPQLAFRGALVPAGGAAGVVRAWLDVELGFDFEMLEEPDPDRAGALEGETLLF